MPTSGFSRNWFLIPISMGDMPVSPPPANAHAIIDYFISGSTNKTSWSNDGNGNGLLFHMTQPTSRSTIKAIACSKPTISENYSKWKHNGTIADHCKQSRALCHIGLTKDRGGHLVNQSRLWLFDKCWETTVGDPIGIMKRKTKNEWTQNMVKKMYRWKRMPMYIDEWIEFKWRNMVWLEYF